MDGAIILAADGSRVARANVHLVPDPDIPTSETGTRHRTAERVARQISVPVHHHLGGDGRRLGALPRLQEDARADPARARPRRPGAADPRPVQGAPRRCERRVVGARSRRSRHRARRRDGAAARRDGAAHRRGDRGLRRRARRRRPARRASARRAHRRRRAPTAGSCARTTSSSRSDWVLEQVTHRLGELTDEELLDLRHVSALLHLPADMDLDSSLQPRGYRLLSKIPRLPEAIAENVVQRFGQLPKIMRASISDLVGSKASAKPAPARSRTACPASPRPRSSTATRSFLLVGGSLDCRSGELASLAALFELGSSVSVHGCAQGRSDLRRHGRTRARWSIDGADVPIVHARPDGLPVAGLVLHPDIMGLAPAVRRHGAAPRDARACGVCGRTVRARRPTSRSGSIEARMAAVSQLDDDVQLGDLDAAATCSSSKTT